MINPKRKRNNKATKVPAAPLNDGINSPVPNRDDTTEKTESEAALFKQAENPLGDPHKT